eukprot:gb/GFBE01004400.1/.p1 GENE.gb/GFBE01004400.1/~~gb/GFBE01004400.1/.p1  ORF type:complete len:361 (+),score=66.03 gb/GFBE01004400.1/:1-1083(+)
MEGRWSRLLNSTVNATSGTALPTGKPRPSGSLWPFGVALAVFGTLVGTVGKQLIRRSELYKQEHREREGSILFVLGLALQVALNPACDLAGYALAPASVIAPVTGMDIVWNTVMAPCSLNEELTSRRLLSSMIIFLTATASVLFRQINEVDWTAQHVLHTMLQTRTMLYAICFVAWYLLNVCVFMKYERGSPVRGFSLGATAGTLAGNMWCTKITAVLTEQCFSGDCAAWHHWISWVMLVGAVFFSTSNLYYISRGMQQYEALFMVTVYMGSNIVTNCVSAIVVLAEMDSAPWWKLGGYTLCILGMMAGMVLLTEGEKEPSARDRVPCIQLSEDVAETNYGESVRLGAPSSWDRVPSGGI